MFNALLMAVLIQFLACNTQYTPQDLDLMSESELLEKAQNWDLPLLKYLLLRDQDGQVLAYDSIKFGDDIWFDFYANDSDEIQEVIVRPASLKDLEFRRKLDSVSKIGPNLEMVDIDCKNLNEILQRVHDLDQGSRTGNSRLDPKQDLKNLGVVISIIEHCGMPTLNEVGYTQMSAIWLVLQHSPHSYMKKYVHYIRAAVENGDLNKSRLAMMEDRILLGENKPQIYGTQVEFDQTTKTWVLSELKSPEYVNKRRRQVGLGSIEDYLQNFGIVFNIEQKYD